MNKVLNTILFALIFISNVKTQTNLETIIEGKVTYLSSQNVYVKFDNTDKIKVGDTLFVKQKNDYLPAVKIEYLSSRSTAGKKLGDINLRVGDRLLYFYTPTALTHEPEIIAAPAISEQTIKNEVKIKSSKSRTRKIGRVEGRVSLSSYSNFSSTKGIDFVRWRYTFAARSQNFNSSRLSFDSYISFNYRSTDWNYIKNNINDALKIYSLALGYDIGDNLNLTFGRKINRNITNIGAIDGLQLQGKFGKFTSGVIVGSRPDYKNYSFNSNLFEFGGFISHSDIAGYGVMQNSFALFQQTNDFKTDRRFFYFQHNSNFIKQINFFFSTEVDLYKKENGVSSSDFSLTGLYVSLRYKPIRKLSLSGSFDSRKNVIYYETYKNYADSLYENATRQGFNFRINLRPWNNLFFRFAYGFRTRTGDVKSSQNFSGSISYTRVPFIRGTVSLNYNNLATSYLNGNIFSLSYSRDLLSGILFATLNFRKVLYQFLNGPDLDQNIVTLDVNWRIIRYLSASLAYEGTFETEFNYGRVYFNLTKRF
ncbi:MAG: hypothetical protein GXO85_01880 [Chlorobi bacterium]|nr:hypothetical protein [Chlorobiota bacterium]